MRLPTDAQGRLLAMVEQHQPVRLNDRGQLWHQRGPMYWGKGRVNAATVRVVLTEGWIDRDVDDMETTLTEDGVIALGRWRERKRAEPPPPLPMLSDREREVVELAQRARELGYALCACEPTRLEARRMRKAGWFAHCWVANSAYGLVPSPLALVEVRPDEADAAPTDHAHDHGEQHVT